MKLEINRAEWLRGEKHESCLLRDIDGKRCCLGIYGRALGIPDHVMLDAGQPERPKEDEEDPSDPDDLACTGKSELWPDWLAIAVGTPDRPTDEWRLISTNDDPDMSGEEREKMIASLFARHDVEVTFVDGPAPEPVR